MTATNSASLATRAQKAEKALADFQRLSRDAASRARAAHDLELQAQARELDAAYASRSAQAASDTVHVDPESGAAFTLGSRQRKAARVSSGGGGAVPRVSSGGVQRVSSGGGARPSTSNVQRSTPSFAPASPRLCFRANVASQRSSGSRTKQNVSRAPRKGSGRWRGAAIAPLP